MTSPWWRTTITARPDQVDAIAAAIVTQTGNGVEEPSPGVVCTTLETRAAVDLLLRHLGEHFDNAVMSVAATEPVDWSTRWRDGIETRHFGRVILTPSWLPVISGPDQVVLTIDPESAFGSGEHGSTRGALTLLEQLLHDNDRVLDLGSGSGILAIAAALLGARSAIGIEMHDESIPFADANAARNGVADRVTFLLGDAGELAPLAGPADLICSNILRNVNTQLLPAILDSLAPGGTIIFAGMEYAEADLFRPVLERHRLLTVREIRDANWWSVAVRRG